MRNPKALSLVAAVTLAGCSVDASTSEPPKDVVVADLRADSNRDGEVRFDDDSDAERATWNDKTGAIFLANIDDDLGSCKKTGDDVTLAACNDAVDEEVNGEDDALDLARLKTKPWPDAPAETKARITIGEAAIEHVRLFKKTGEGAADFTVVAADEALTLEEIRAGVELGIEAKDIVRDPAVWDGHAEITLSVTSPKGNADSTVKLRVAPVLTFHHLEDAEQIFISQTGTPGNGETRRDLASACAATSAPDPTAIPEGDPWAQDFFETGFMSMPGPGGEQHAIRVNYRSANVFSPKSLKTPLRPAGQVVFRLRGKDVAGIQQFDVKHEQSMDSLNSFGNWETVPPYSIAGEKYPLGRVLRGRTTSFYPDKAFTTMIDAQLIQPAIDIDTSWLLVGHVDETISFTHANNDRGWVLLVNDARMAKQMLEAQVAAGRGGVEMFVGKTWVDWESNAETPAAISISAVLADTEVMKASADAAVEVDAQVAKLKKEIGLTDAEIVKVPFLHMAYGGVSVAYQPGMVNGLYVKKGQFLAPDPHGPVIAGQDIFKKAMSDALAPHGVSVTFVEDWEYHVGGGELHCGTNAARAIPAAKWWESGR